MTKARERELLKRISDLEKQVRELKAHPQVQHHHYWYPSTPYYVPQPYYIPVQPSGPWWTTTTAGGPATTTVAVYDETVPHTQTFALNAN